MRSRRSAGGSTGCRSAIELAAARTKLLSPRAIVARLENRLELLTGGARDLPSRHRTLRGAIDWTHELLDADEQAVFASPRRVRGRLPPEDAEAVCDQAGAAALLDVLASLVDKSLLVRRDGPDGDVRLEMLQTIREYARYRLIERGELDDARAPACRALPRSRRVRRGAAAGTRPVRRRAAVGGRHRQRTRRARVVAGDAAGSSWGCASRQRLRASGASATR